MLIAVIGERNSSPELLKEAEEVGRQLGKRRIVLICGGLEESIHLASSATEAVETAVDLAEKARTV